MDRTIEMVDKFLKSTEKEKPGKEKYHHMLRVTANGITKRYREHQQAKGSRASMSLSSYVLDEERALNSLTNTREQTPKQCLDQMLNVHIIPPAGAKTSSSCAGSKSEATTTGMAQPFR